MRYHVGVGGEDFEVERLDAGLRMRGVMREAELTRLGEAEFHLVLDGSGHRVFARRMEGGWRLTVRGRTFDVGVEDERARAIRLLADAGGGDAGPREIRAPMPGLIVRVLVAPGERVAAGDGVVVIEAMKMENELRAGDAGTVGDVAVRAGDVVDREQVLVTLAPEGA